MHNKPFPIDNYFMYISERYLDKGIQMVDERALSLKKQVKGGLWLFEILNGDSYEIEVLVGRKMLKTYSCDCPTFQRNHICSHIAAAVVWIARHRAEKVQQKQRQQANRSKRRTSRHLEANRIIDHISEKDLRTFVRQYALSNTSFSLKLKSQFAHNIELSDNLNKYFNLLKRNENHIVKGKINSIKFKKIIHYLRDLLDLSDDLASKENYQEAANIIYGSLKYLISRQSLFQNYPHDESTMLAHTKLKAFLNMEAAPELVTAIQKNTRDLYLEYQYHLIDTRLNLYHILYFSIQQKDRSIVVDDLKKRVNDNLSTELEILTLFSLLIEEDDHPGIRELWTTNNKNIKLVPEFFLALDKHQHKDLRYDLAKDLYKVADGKKLRKIALEQLISLETDSDAKEYWLLDYYLKHPDLDTIDRLKDVSRNWIKTRKYLVDHLDKKAQLKDLSALLKKEGLIEPLKEIMSKSMSIELLLENAQFIYPYDPIWLKNEILAEMKNHLNRHLGSQSVDYVARIIRNLNKLNLNRLSREIQHELIINFSERSFFTKALRVLV